MLSNSKEWFHHRSFTSDRFGDLAWLADRKDALGATVSLVLPAREVRETVGHIVTEVARMGSGSSLVDQILVVDADSADGTADVARSAGAEVYSENELLAAWGPARGKGDAMWRSLSVAYGDIVMFADADTVDFDPRLIYGVLGPVLTVPRVQFVKAAFRRPFAERGLVFPNSGGRVTELTARPLLNLFYPQLAGFAQPLAGEFAATRELLCSIPFLTGYAIEIAMLIDVLSEVGLDAMAQVDVLSRQNRHQPLADLSRMSYAVLRAVMHRLYQEQRLCLPGGTMLHDSPLELHQYLLPQVTPEGLTLCEHCEELVVRPPLRTVETVKGACRPRPSPTFS
jgi:glucosyl-3-phosphoglycerate synthase